MRHDAHTLVAAYAAGALEEHERADVEEHLAECDVCRDDLRGFREALASLAAAAAEAPPARMREAVLARARRTPQLPPLPAADEAGAPSTSATPTSGRPAPPPGPVPPTSVTPTPVPPVRVAGDHGPAEPLRSRPVRRGASSTLFALAATALTVVALGAGVWAWTASDELSDVRARQAAVQRVLSAEDVVSVSARPELGDGLQGDEVVVLSSEAADAALLLPSGLPEAPEGSTWQAWTVTGDDAVSAGVFDVRGGEAVALSSGVTGVDAVAVSLEPSGGSEAPTSDPVLVVPLA